MLRSCRVSSRVTRWFWGLGLGLAVMNSVANGPGPAIVAGDLIVKFKETSESGRQLALAARGEGMPDKNLAAVATQLSAALGVSLTAVRVTSGRELVLTVDRAKLLQTIARQLSRDAVVSAVSPVESAATVLPAAHIDFRVELVAGSEAQRRVRQAAVSGSRSTPGIEALVTQLAAGISPPPTGHVDKQGRLILRYDVMRLTRDLVARLQTRADVEYAQFSQLVKPYAKP